MYHIRNLRRLTIIASFATVSMAGAYSYNQLPSLNFSRRPDINNHLIVDNEAAIMAGYFGKVRLEGEELTAWMNDREYQHAPNPMPGAEVAKFHFASREICLSGIFGGDYPASECHSMDTLDNVQRARLKNLACDTAARDSNTNFLKLHCS